MDSRLINFIIAGMLGIPASYILECLFLSEKSSHYGPFRSEIKKIKFISTQHEQPVVLWDYIRRIAGVYKVIGNFWIVEEDRVSVERFTCPFCLSFWVAAPFSIIFSVATWGITLNGFFWLIVYHFTIAVVSQLFYRWLY